MSETPDAAGNASQADYWNAAAGEAWAELQDRLDRQLEPLGRRAMQVLAPAAGERVLDIGCGSGQTTLALGRAVAPGGTVLGVDISRPLLEVARRRALESGLAGVSFEQADAQAFAFEPSGFDAAFSRFGVMFFADPVAAFRNIKAALRPGGRLAFVCWRTPAENVFMSLPLAAAASRLPPLPAAPPSSQGPFAFADPQHVRGILEAAGFGGIEIARHDQLVGGGDLEDTLGLALKVGPLGRLLREHPGRRDQVIQAVREALTPHVTPQGVRLDSASWIVSARAD